MFTVSNKWFKHAELKLFKTGKMPIFIKKELEVRKSFINENEYKLKIQK